MEAFLPPTAPRHFQVPPIPSTAITAPHHKRPGSNHSSIAGLLSLSRKAPVSRPQQVFLPRSSISPAAGTGMARGTRGRPRPRRSELAATCLGFCCKYSARLAALAQSDSPVHDLCYGQPVRATQANATELVFHKCFLEISAAGRHRVALEASVKLVWSWSRHTCELPLFLLEC